MAANKKILLDASFVAAWLQISDAKIPLETQEAVFRADTIIAPNLLDYEIGNVIWKYLKKKNRKISISYSTNIRQWRFTKKRLPKRDF